MAESKAIIVVVLSLMASARSVSFDKQIRDAARFMKSNGFHFVSILSDHSKEHNLHKSLRQLANSNIYSKVADLDAQVLQHIDSFLILISIEGIQSRKIDEIFIFLEKLIDSLGKTKLITPNKGNFSR